MTWLIDRLYPAGVRSMPVAAAEITPSADWVRARLDDPELGGGHGLRSWSELSNLIERVGEGGVVLAYTGNGRDLAMYTKAGSEIWSVSRESSSVEAKPWTAPPDLPTVDPPRLMALAFNKCADPIPQPAPI